jgi:predicted glycogen debranching enzyme
MISFGREVCTNLERALGREWLETNGLGGYASSTITNLNTRRYHGLLVAAANPPVGRFVLLSKLEETLVVGGRRFELSSNQYPGAIQPRGFEHQVGFRLDPFPVFTYRVEGVEVEKSVFMIQGENAVVIRYELRRASDISAQGSSPVTKPCRLEVRPLIAFRDYHSLTRENGALDSRFQAEENLLTIKPYADLPALHFAHDADDVAPDGQWYRNFEYEAERERGFDFQEDLFCPAVFRADFTSRTRFHIIASTTRNDVSRAPEVRRAEIERRMSIRTTATPPETSRATATTPETPADNLITSLVVAADAYTVARGDGKTVIAGYHWFGDWGRDTMIALPGLALVTGRFETARSILSEFARHVDCGMLPNRFPDAGQPPEYNTADATLWFFEAVRSFLHYTNEHEFVRASLYDVLVDIVEWHVGGTRYGIRVDADALLVAGAGGVQLTWMDAKVGDRVVTPRAGKPVEIQALWYNALRVMENLAGGFGDAAAERRYAEMAERAGASFNELFWNEDTGCLFDVVDGETRDASVRPNQIFAVSLPHSMLSGERVRRVVEVVERDLLTPFGLRSLAPGDPRYCGRYAGDSSSRDGAYHQGTVWAWLMGPFITAYVKAHGASEEARGRAEGWLANFDAHLSEAGLGHVSEIFDGDAPHTPRGCIAQAWSVAELLRAGFEDVYRR